MTELTYLPARHLGQNLDGLCRVADGGDDDPPLVGRSIIERTHCLNAEARQHACQQEHPSARSQHCCHSKAACKAYVLVLGCDARMCRACICDTASV